jgi:hypothetical protein
MGGDEIDPVGETNSLREVILCKDVSASDNKV